jgi:mannose-6-phosphate isomerase-like protein (cupin superfamily)
MKTVKKPWGLFRQFAVNKKCTVKILEVNSKQELSLQKHDKREELWYFFDKATVQLGKKKINVKKGDTIKIRKKQLHRIIAKNKVKVLEISLGNFQEKDIKRIEDKYGRK